MKLLLDENVPRLLIPRLTQAGHDVTHVGEHASGLDDPDVLQHAIDSQRAIITSDLDPAELIVRGMVSGSVREGHRIRAVAGLLTLRGFASLSPVEFGDAFDNIWWRVEPRLLGHLVTAKGQRLRFRPLPHEGS